MSELARTALALLVLVVVAGVVPLADGVRQAGAVAWAAARGAVQLLTVGLVLGAVFRAPAAELPAVGWWRRPAAVAIAVTSGAAVTGTVVFASGALPFGVRNVVALGGITLGGAMTASTLAGRRFLAELHGRRPEVEGKLALGVTMRQATAELMAVAIGEALVPALDQTRTTELVTFPRAFVDALFGSASPLATARFQLVVLVGLLAAQSVAAVVLLRLLAAVPYLPTRAATAEH